MSVAFFSTRVNVAQVSINVLTGSTTFDICGIKSLLPLDYFLGAVEIATGSLGTPTGGAERMTRGWQNGPHSIRGVRTHCLRHPC